MRLKDLDNASENKKLGCLSKIAMDCRVILLWIAGLYCYGLQGY